MVDRGETRPDRQRTRALLSRLTEATDAEREGLREELVVAHLNLVRFLAMKFVNRGEPLDDLVQVGTLGLLKAIDRFDTERGVEFTTYATPTIVGEIKRHFRDKGWAVKVPRRLQELNQSVNRSVDALAIELGRSPTVAELAERLNASEEEIL
jgi:RNA polymerase sigma-B factor